MLLVSESHVLLFGVIVVNISSSPLGYNINIERLQCTIFVILI